MIRVSLSIGTWHRYMPSFLFHNLPIYFVGNSHCMKYWWDPEITPSVTHWRESILCQPRKNYMILGMANWCSSQNSSLIIRKAPKVSLWWCVAQCLLTVSSSGSSGTYPHWQRPCVSWSILAAHFLNPFGFCPFSRPVVSVFPDSLRHLVSCQKFSFSLLQKWICSCN